MIRLFFVFLLLSHSSFSQTDDTTSITEDWATFYVPNIMCFDHDVPMFRFVPDSLESFEFRLYNRWGELMACSNDVQFELIDNLTVPRSAMKEFETYTYVLHYKIEGKEEQRFQGHFTFIENCNCG